MVRCRSCVRRSHGFGPTHIPGGQVGPCPPTHVLMFDAHGLAGRGRQRPAGTLASLDTRLLVCRDDELVVAQGDSVPVPFVEIQDPPRLDPEVRVAREDPTAMLPRTDGVLVQPAPNGLVADAGDDTGAANFARHIRDAHARQRKSQIGRQLTCQRLDLNDHLRGGKPGGVRAGGAPQVPAGVRGKTVSATG